MGSKKVSGIKKSNIAQNKQKPKNKPLSKKNSFSKKKNNIKGNFISKDTTFLAKSAPDTKNKIDLSKKTEKSISRKKHL
jgi:hypothetical protein